MTDAHTTGPFIAAIDQGTTSSRCIVFDKDGRIVSVDQKEHEQILPKPGWVEHNATEIWENVQEVVAGAIVKAGITSADVKAIGITNQRETTLLWDKNTGEPVHNALVWQDTRTDVLCKELGRNVGQDRFRRQTGLPLASYFAGPKVRWLLDNVEGLRERAERGDILFGTMDSWVIWNLTGGTDGGVHVTDVTNASRTLLMNLHTMQWDNEIVRSMDIPRPYCLRSAPPPRSTAMPRAASSTASRWPPRSATSRPRCSVRRVSPRARPSPRTAPAPSCC